MSDRWCDFRPVVTAFDLLDSGACFEGVRDAVKARRRLAAPTDRHVRNKYVARAAHANGYGDGDHGYGGYGYGGGYGCDDSDGGGYGDGGYGNGGYGDGGYGVSGGDGGDGEGYGVGRGD